MDANHALCRGLELEPDNASLRQSMADLQQQPHCSVQKLLIAPHFLKLDALYEYMERPVRVAPVRDVERERERYRGPVLAHTGGGKAQASNPSLRCGECH